MNIHVVLFASQMKACISLDFLYDRAYNQAQAADSAFCLYCNHYQNNTGSQIQQYNPVLYLLAKSTYEFVLDIIP